MKLVFDGSNSSSFGVVLMIILIMLVTPLLGNQVNHERVSKNDDDSRMINFHIGVIVDMESLLGRAAFSSISSAVSESTCASSNATSIDLHFEDSKGDPLTTITSAVDLVKSFKVDAMIVQEMTSEVSTLMASLGDKAEVPIFSLSSIPSPTTHDKHPYLIQMRENEVSQFGGIIDLLQNFGWRNVALIYEGIDGEKLTKLLEKFSRKGIHVGCTSMIIHQDDDQIIQELNKLSNMKQQSSSVFIVHASPATSSKIFMNSKNLGMMSEGSAWIVTSKTMDFLHSLDPFVLESMQGVIGLKSYVPEAFLQNQTMEFDQDAVEIGMRAHDTICALTEAAKIHQTRMSTVNNRNSNRSALLSEMLNLEFRGVGGDFGFEDGKFSLRSYQVVNVLGKGEEGVRVVGSWTMDHGFTRQGGVEGIIWPGLSKKTPGNWFSPASNRRLRIVFPAKIGFKEFIGLEADNEKKDGFKVTGFCRDVFDAAIGRLGYHVQYDLFPFNYTTEESWQSQGNYNDIINQVYHKKYDAAIGDITITSNRSLYVDFTLPFTEEGAGTLVKLDRENRWFFLKPLDSDLWIAAACLFVLLGITLWIIEHPINEEFQGSRASQIGTVLWFSVSTLVYAHRERLRSNLSKFVLGVWLFVVFILTSSYTAILSSILTVQQIQLANGDYIGYGSPISRGIVAHSNMNFSDNRLKAYKSTEQFHDALSRGSKRDGVAAIIEEIPYLKVFLAKYSSGFLILDTSPVTNGFGFVFQKGSPLVPEISRAIAKLREDGTLLELEKKWYTREVRDEGLLHQDSEQSKPKTLSLENFIGLFIISGLSKTIALLILLFYFLRNKLSIKHYLLRILTRGTLAQLLQYLYPTLMEHSNDETLPR